MDIPDLLDSFLLLYHLTELNHISMDAIILTVGLQIMDVTEQTLVVSEGHALEIFHPGTAHVSDDSSDEIDCGEHLLHCQGLCCRTAVHDPLDLFAGPVQGAGGHRVLVHQHDDMTADSEQVA